MKLVIVESPYGAPSQTERDYNTQYAYLACRDCLERGESAWGSHLIWPQFLDDNNPENRRVGIHAGLAWSRAADYHVFYTDRGWSSGMLAALDHCITNQRPLRLRALNGSIKFPPDDWFDAQKWPSLIADYLKVMAGVYE